LCVVIGVMVVEVVVPIGRSISALVVGVSSLVGHVAASPAVAHVAASASSAASTTSRVVGLAKEVQATRRHRRSTATATATGAALATTVVSEWGHRDCIGAMVVCFHVAKLSACQARTGILSSLPLIVRNA